MDEVVVISNTDIALVSKGSRYFYCAASVILYIKNKHRAVGFFVIGGIRFLG